MLKKLACCKGAISCGSSITKERNKLHAVGHQSIRIRGSGYQPVNGVTDRLWRHEQLRC